jgi:DNA-binding MarR family transcriptional regulator
MALFQMVERIDPMREWSFLTDHAVVLTYIAKQPGSTVGQIASVTGISQRALCKVIADLDSAGYITRKQEGRESHYSVSPDLILCNDQPQESALIGFLEALGW